MDESEKYIKMCDCPEIQEHMIADGDMFYRVYKFSISGNDYILPQTGIMGIYDSEFHNSVITKTIWLPRQDQLQEMIGSFKSVILNIMINTHSTLWADQSGSIEEYLLRMYMWDNHEKCWWGESWDYALNDKRTQMGKVG